MLYLNGDINKIDKAFASLPFAANFPIDEKDALSKVHSDVTVHKCNAYRKGNNSVNLNCDINVSLKFKNDDEITVIRDIAEIKPLDRSKMPSLIFRVVQSGETLWDIAKNYNLSINYLKELNDIPEDKALAPGTKIIIARTV
jgi:LysM repeat protein